jgi:L-fuconolactonase
MRIDAHQHFWKYNAARDTWITDDMLVLRRDFLPVEFARECQANGIDASVAVQADQSEAETRFLLDLAEENSRIAGVVGWIDLRSASLAERLEFFSKFPKLRGFRHIAQSEPDDRFLLREDFTRGIAQLQRFGFTYDILIYPKQLPAVLELVERFPNQRFVIDHLAKPEIKAGKIMPWGGYVKRIAENKNVFCKASGLVTEADWRGWKQDDFRPYLNVVFDAFGVDRLMFGSDWPVCLLAASYRQVKQIVDDYTKDLSPQDREKIFGGNAIKFYGLKAVSHGLAA